MDAMTICNSCDWRKMYPGEARGYCAKCACDAAQDAMLRARDRWQSTTKLMAVLLDDEHALPDERRQQRSAVRKAQDAYDAAKDLVRTWARRVG
jgi:hypothetical protein